MRLPLAKAYRAFPALDPFDDATCKAYMRRARKQGRFARFALALLGAGAGAVVGVLLAVLIGTAVDNRYRDVSVAFWVGAGIAIFTLCLCPALGAALTSDALIARQLRRRLRTADCMSCGYALVGQVPVTDEVERRDYVVCPECGRRSVVGAGGIPRHNLINGGSSMAAPDEEIDDTAFAERVLIRKNPALRQFGPEGMDEAIGRIESGHARRWRVSVGAGVGAAVAVAGVVMLVGVASPIAPRSLLPGYFSLSFMVWAFGIVGLFGGWVVGAWTKRIVRGFLTGADVERAIDLQARDGVGGADAVTSAEAPAPP